MRTTSTPACTMRSSTVRSEEAGPRVATILVWRGMPRFAVMGSTVRKF
jgi:hypothetical protein